MRRYKVVRHFQRDTLPAEVVARGLTLEQAQAHCKDPETSSRTATGVHAVERTRLCGAWFDGYDPEDEDCAECDGTGQVRGYVPIGMDHRDGYVHEREVREDCDACNGTGTVPAEEEG